MELFDYSIGNPPYQMDIKEKGGGQRQTKDIYPEFQMLTTSISKNSTLIYPATWQKNIKTPLGEYLYTHNINRVNNYISNQVFPEIRGNFPLSVVNTINEETKNIIINGDFYLDKNTPYFIDSKVKYILYNKVKNKKKIINGTRNLTKISNLKELNSEYSFSKEGFINPVKILAKKNPGLQPDSIEVYIEYENIKDHILNFDDFNKYKVATRSRSVGRLPVFTDTYNTVGILQARVFAPGEAYGMTWTTMRSFSSEIEAVNYSRYVNTKFFINLCSLDITRKSFASPLPELEYGENSVINWDSQKLDEELLDYFKFNKKEKELILSFY